ncbi:putative low-complexity protein [Rivularia sp. PCC 7116]|uniref:pentapeptide repeat-containing protein n=1 Tax=Rivularia sp. PCC 7116 TaxID=373994 RepID=UPI00029EC8D2|nr:pentapeptide repeat-containing protein [Rivularia sp. PCC 7116]AFY57612.1 putative low-complexity protein [Rivularia sp. PCC 7116]
MTDLNLNGRKKQKITYTASNEGIEEAERALKRLGFESKSNFAKSQLISRTTVTKFFNHQPIQLDSFKRICDALTLEWGEIAELREKKQLESFEKTACSGSMINKEVEVEMTSRRQVTVIDKKSETIKVQITLEGDINSVSNFKILELILREHSGDTIKVIDIQEGSIKLTIEGSQQDIERLVERIQSGEITEVNGFPVTNFQILGESSGDRLSNEAVDKWSLVQEIVTQPIQERDLRGIDLSDADLSGADLSYADLSYADLSGADLSGADLTFTDLKASRLSSANLNGTDLSGANLIFIDLSGADLSYADLSYAELNNAFLSGANLSSADLSAVDLSYADLNDADLSDADLSAANLKGTKINNKTKLDNKWFLVWTIVNFDAVFQNLRNVDLRSADLRNTNLSNVDLSGAFLENADLSGANLSDADLSNANLIGAKMSGTNLSRVKVKGAIFGDNIDLPKDMECDLENGGAIFNDSPGDRSGALARY